MVTVTLYDIMAELSCSALPAAFFAISKWRMTSKAPFIAIQLNPTQLNSTGRRRGVQSDSTHSSTQLDVELSWVELCRYKRALICYQKFRNHNNLNSVTIFRAKRQLSLIPLNRTAALPAALSNLTRPISPIVCQE